MKNAFYKLLVIASFVLLYSCAKPTTFSYTDSSLYVFGDSLSDVGNARIASSGLVPDKNYYQGRFSNGPLYVDDLAAKLNTPLKPSREYGSDYAFAGATSLEIAAQIFNYQENVDYTANSQAFYLIWAGGNDLLEILQGTNTQLTTDDVVANIAKMISELADSGAKKIIVPNLIDMSLLPQIQKLGQQNNAILALATNTSSQFNVSLQAMLTNVAATKNITIFSFDVNALFNDIIANPGNYGFSNISDPCYVKNEQSVELTGNETICSNPDVYLFWDSIHPSAAAHRLIAEKLYTLIGG